MIMSVVTVGLLFISLLVVVISSTENPCRVLPFHAPISDRALANHVIDTSETANEKSCRIQCYLNKLCVSINYRRLEDDRLICELSSSDHLQHPQDMVPKDEFVYTGTKNGCSKNRCPQNATCLPGDIPTTHSCVCPSGYTGEICQHDVDECSTGLSKCPADSHCNNTVGSYNCTCNPGYTDDGITCADINECLDPMRCAGNATCYNTRGSYNCTCNEGFVGNGREFCNVTGIDCKDILTRFPSALNDLYYLDPDGGNHDNAFLAYCDMTSHGGGWTMCYTSNKWAKPKTEVTYSPQHPYGTNGYRTNCNDLMFNEVLFIKESIPRQLAYFRRQTGIPLKVGDNYGNKATSNGLWEGHGVATTSYRYQLLICHESLVSGFMVSGFYRSCYKLCNHWCSDYTSDYYRMSATNAKYYGVSFKENGFRVVPFKLISIGVRMQS